MNRLDDDKMRRNPFEVPDDYFNQLTERILAKDEIKKPERKVGIVQFLYPYIGFAAVFLIGFFVADVFLPSEEAKQSVGVSVLAGHHTAVDEVSDDEFVFDESFNPTQEEIIEYLSSEVGSYEMMLAGIY